jgi:hypothetical protein
MELELRGCRAGAASAATCHQRLRFRLCGALAALSECSVGGIKMPAAQVPGMMTTYEVVKPGSGTATVSKGSKVTVHAEGNVQQADGSLFKFWSTKGRLKRSRRRTWRRWVAAKR